MARITDFPDELLIYIASYFDRSDNLALALTTRKLRGAAQEALHTRVELPFPPESLPLILRTLVQRLDLAVKVRSAYPSAFPTCFSLSRGTQSTLPQSFSRSCVSHPYLWVISTSTSSSYLSFNTWILIAPRRWYFPLGRPPRTSTP